MKAIGLFLIPTSYTGGKVPLDYRVERREIDRRTRFWKVNKPRLLGADANLLVIARGYGMGVFWNDAGELRRILAPNKKAASAFVRHMTFKGWRDKE